MDAVLFAVLLVLAALAIFLLARRRAARAGESTFSASPDNLGLYDHPYYYPEKEARLATSWDKSHRCAAYCSAGGCAVWCR